MMTAKRLRILSVAAVACLAIAGGLLVMISGNRPYTVRVYLLSAARLVPGNNVDMDGVPVGQVASVQLAPDNETAGAIVTIEISGRYAPLRQGTRAVVRPDGAVGEEFMELDAVPTGPAIPPGGSIPLPDTQVSVTLDQVTNVLDATTRQELKTLTLQGGTALRGRGAGLNHVLTQLPRISSDLAATTGSLDQQTQQLSELDAEFNRVAAMIAGEHRGLAGDVRNGASILNTLAQHQASLQAELQQGNSSLGQANAALAGRQQDVHQLLAQLPGLLQVLRTLESRATTSVGIINPCMQNLLATLNNLASAGNYRQPAGSTDGAGYMLRVDPQVLGPDTGTFSPSAACSGGGG
jgi:phospholipid/cholesterol/gamma-HCH transport system substrate-binding protein